MKQIIYSIIITILIFIIVFVIALSIHPLENGKIVDVLKGRPDLEKICDKIIYKAIKDLLEGKKDIPDIRKKNDIKV
jgi:hypothetical protein